MKRSMTEAASTVRKSPCADHEDMFAQVESRRRCRDIALGVALERAR